MFVTAFNGPRDDYQVPLALHERGILTRHVADAYLPFPLPYASPELRRRHCPGLPGSKVKRRWKIGLENLRLRRMHGSIDTTERFRQIDHTLSMEALRQAERRQANLLLYSRYAAPAFSDPASRNMRKGLFFFHPFEPYSRQLLAADVTEHPEAKWSIEHEIDFVLRSRDAELEQEWRLADFIICASSFTRKSLVESGCEPSKISVAPYGSDTAETPWKPEMKSQDKRLRVLFVGQGVQRKGLHHLLKAWRQMPKNRAVLTVVSYRADPGILALAGDGIEILPKQSAEALAELFQRSHVFALPSLVDGFGLVLLDALANGCHIIGSPNSGLPDLDLPSHLYQLVTAGDVNGLAEALRQTLELHETGQLDHEGARKCAELRSREEFRRKVADIAEQSL